MTQLSAKIRRVRGKKNKLLRKQGILPAILYGEGIQNLPLEVLEKEFEKVYKEAGESSLIKLKIKKPQSYTEQETENEKEVDVLIHQTARDPLSGRFLHIDFFHPSTKKEIEAEIPLVFAGEAPAVKELGGTLVREVQLVKVRGLAKNLPREIVVNLKVLQNFENRIRIKDLKVPQGVTIQRGPEEIVALVTPAEEMGKEEEIVSEKPEEEKKVGEELSSKDKP